MLRIFIGKLRGGKKVQTQKPVTSLIRKRTMIVNYNVSLEMTSNCSSFIAIYDHRDLTRLAQDGN